MEQSRLRSIYARLKNRLSRQEERYLVVSIEDQRMFLCEEQEVVQEYAVSTSRFGVGGRENSLRTPPGLHRICEKYGTGAPAGRVFRDREDTGEDWDHKQNGDNLILSRILRLEGLEPGINKGPGVDSYDRYIYIHGTGREDRIGTPLSHGCVVLRNHDVMRLFDSVSKDTLVYIDPPPVFINGSPCRSVHFTGIFGSGMSALAQYLRFQGISVSGSDRFYVSEDTAVLRRSLEILGCEIAPQDGSAVTEGTDAVCISTAIEDSNPDIATARGLGIQIIHRSDLLAAVMGTKRTIAVAGTSGKSTVTAMIFEFLTACDRSPSLLCGAPLKRLERQGMIGNAWSGGSDLLVVEADESDGTLVKYRPEATAVLNVSKDHKTVDELRDLFGTLAAQSSWTALNADDPALRSLRASVYFGRNGTADWRPDREELLPDSVRLVRKGTEYHLFLPGVHNLENLLAALCVCEHFGCKGEVLTEAVRNYEGVARRFTVARTRKGVTVIDDFAHNPAKISAAVNAARGLASRIVAVYQPHGFGPTRFLKNDYIEAFRKVFMHNDSLYLLPIYYAGGTAKQDIRSQDIIDGLRPAVFTAKALQNRGELLAELSSDAKVGDCVLVMGARDPSLPGMTAKIVELFGGIE